MSWGTKIAMLYIGFVLLVIFMVTLSMNQKIELVSADYYANELKYQDKIDQMNNANSLGINIETSIDSNDVKIVFPLSFINEEINGNVFFFRPSDASKDYKTELKINEKGQQLISLIHLTKGMYKMQLSWSASDKNYFIEKVIIIP